MWMRKYAKVKKVVIFVRRHNVSDSAKHGKLRNNFIINSDGGVDQQIVIKANNSHSCADGWAKKNYFASFYNPDISVYFF